MPISGRQWPRQRLSCCDEKVLRGGLFGYVANFVIDRILSQIAIRRQHLSVWSNENPVVLVVLLDTKLAFMHQWVMTGTTYKERPYR